MEMPGCGKNGNPKVGFPPFHTPWKSLRGVPHSHGYGCDYHLLENQQSPPKTRN
jgi:hypothetical protein